MATHIDPVCDMQVEEEDAAGLSEYKGRTYYFDSEECMKKFNQHPERYAEKWLRRYLATPRRHVA